MSEGGEMKPYMPANGCEMMDFYAAFCDKCHNPAELAWTWDDIPPGCGLIVQATAENRQPTPWVVNDGKPCCLDFKAAP